MSNTKASLTQQNTQTYPSNTSGSITALSVKSFNNNFINAVATLDDTNVFTEPQTFGNTVQINSNVYANNIPYINQNNTFVGVNTFTGSVYIQSASIQYLDVQNVISQSTVYATGSNQLGDASNDVQTLWGTVDVKTGPLKVSGSVNVSGSIVATSFTGSLQGTSSWANNATTASHALTAVSSSFASNATSASFASTASFLLGAVANAISASYAATASNGFPYTGSAQISGSLTIENSTDGVLLDFKQLSHTTESVLSFRMGNQADITQSISVGSNYLFSGSFNNTYRIVIPTTIDSLVATGSLAGTASWANNSVNSISTASVALNTITFTKGDGSTFPITVDTGSGGGGGGMNLGVNTFTGSQTIQSSSIFLQASSSTALNTNFFTASTAGANFGANVLMFAGSLQSGSFILSGSRNVGTINPGNNSTATTNRSGGNLNGNFGIFAVTSTTASATPVLNNNFLASGVNAYIPNTSSITTLTGNFVGGAITITGSALSNVSITQNNIDAVTIINDFTASGASQSITVSSNLIKGGQSGTTLAQIKFAGTGSGSNTRQFINNIMFGNANTASLEATATANGNMLNTAIIGSNLIVSGTLGSNSLSGSMFVGQFNETGSLADPSQIKFAVGTGTTNASRRTSFFVSQSGEVVIEADGGGTNGRVNSVFGVNFIKLGQNTVNANTTVAAFNGSFMTNGGSIAAGEGNVMIGGGANTITNGRDTAMLGSSYSTINTLSGGAESHNVMVGAQSGVISGSRSRFTGIYSSNNSSISQSIQSAIIAGNFTSLNDTTSSLALGRDTAYTGSASYTLYTQNIDASGSVAITGSLAVTGDVKFASGSNKTMGTAVLDGANPGAVVVSNSLATTSSLIFLTKQTLTNAHMVAVSSKGSGTFTITSNGNGDTDTVAYLIINPA